MLLAPAAGRCLGEACSAQRPTRGGSDAPSLRNGAKDAAATPAARAGVVALVPLPTLVHRPAADQLISCPAVRAGCLSIYPRSCRPKAASSPPRTTWSACGRRASCAPAPHPRHPTPARSIPPPAHRPPACGRRATWTALWAVLRPDSRSPTTSNAVTTHTQPAAGRCSTAAESGVALQISAAPCWATCSRRARRCGSPSRRQGSETRSWPRPRKRISTASATSRSEDFLQFGQLLAANLRGHCWGTGAPLPRAVHNP